MRIVEQKFELWPQTDLLKHVEKCGRICYNSLDRITEDSAIPFIEMLAKRGHTSVLEHGTVYMTLDPGMLRNCLANVFENDLFKNFINLLDSRFTKVHFDPKLNKIFVTTNLRAILEYTPNIFDAVIKDKEHPIVEILKEPTKHHIKRHTVHLTCDIGSLTDYRTHRVFSRDGDDSPEVDATDMSVSAESTRYVNYTKEKNGGELTFIIPLWYSQGMKTFDGPRDNIPNKPEDFDTLADQFDRSVHEWTKAMMAAEDSYFNLIKLGHSPQEARDVLPKATKTELVMTADTDQWKQFFKLRTASGAHPQEVALIKAVEAKFKELNLIE